VLSGLVGSGRTLDQLADAEGVTTKTIRRDIEALEAAGFPIVVDYRDKRGYWSCVPTSLTQKLFPPTAARDLQEAR
jgi:hypothetical protein